MGSTQNNDAADNGYIKYDASDDKFFGASRVIQEEREHIFKKHGIEEKSEQEQYIEKKLTGLAFSGGGIRSASFCLGVLQALSYRNVLKKIDYLSTVSGGGYIGSSMTWLLSKSWKTKSGQDLHLGVDKDNFPYGTYPMLGQPTISGDSANEFNKGIAPKHRGALLRFLRQHGKYLTPGHGITGLSLLAVIIRGSILSIFIYFSLLIILMTLLLWAGAFKSFKDIDYTPLFASDFIFNVPNFSIFAGLTGLFVFVVAAPIYSFVAYRQSKRKNEKCADSQNGYDASEIHKMESKSYKLRRLCEVNYNALLILSIIFIIFGLVPVLYDKLYEWTSGIMPGTTGAVSTAIGFISTISAYIRSRSNKKGFISIGLLVLIGTIALWFGFLLLAYHFSLIIGENWLVFAALSIAVIVVGLYSNLNYISVHRYYRDRLMESFMPDVAEVLEPRETPQQATDEADKARLSAMCGINGNDDSRNMPYHIINTNLVLISSKKAKFKGRGGDNFILSPAYCGSNATGWLDSRVFMDDRMTLPTAMAISGAAVNPNTGVGGDGITRQPYLSLLMGILNFGLGYWVPNPMIKSQSKVPNFFYPGLLMFLSLLSIYEKKKFLGESQDECSDFIQLTDGGHFENLGIYELVRRKANVIIACDAAADPEYTFTDLSNAFEKIRADFGVLIEIPTHQLESLVPRKNHELDKSEFAQKGFIVADILYPDREPGIFIYIKTTFFRSLSADLFGYKQTHSEFPDEPTSDQFFDEKQFEAYRELGYQTAWLMMNDNQIRSNTTLNELFKG